MNPLFSGEPNRAVSFRFLHPIRSGPVRMLGFLTLRYFTSRRVRHVNTTCTCTWPMADDVARGGIGSLRAPCGASGT
eukprot:7237309-Prymnesium_polylepis.1